MRPNTHTHTHRQKVCDKNNERVNYLSNLNRINILRIRELEMDRYEDDNAKQKIKTKTNYARSAYTCSQTTDRLEVEKLYTNSSRIPFVLTSILHV